MPWRPSTVRRSHGKDEASKCLDEVKRERHVFHDNADGFTFSEDAEASG
jgi:hypothetical protein